MAFVQSKLKQWYMKRPKWLFVLYYKMPTFLRNLVDQKARGFAPVKEVRHLDKLSLLPLDVAGTEAIFAPFHDPHISVTLPAVLEPLNASGCQKEHTWCWTLLSWFNCPEKKEAACLNLKAGVDIREFDRLVFCLSQPVETKVRFEIQMDGQWIITDQTYTGIGKRMEISLPVQGNLLDRVRLIFSSETRRSQTIQLSWFGVQNMERIQGLGHHLFSYDSHWHGLIKPIEEWGDPKFEIGLIFSEKRLPALRRKKQQPGWDTNFKLLEEKAAQYLLREPEKDLGEFLPYGDIRYLREREHGKSPYYFEAQVLGFVGLVNNDVKMMHHALRYLMCMVHTKQWTQSAESRLTGSSWDQRCFLEELTTSSVTLLADWFAFALTDRAKELIRQSIWDKGLAVIERDMKKFEYLYHINQGSVFCRARVLGGLYLEQAWFRMGNYVDQAFSDMVHCLGNYIEKDGGINEGVGYFCQTLQAVLPTTIAYSRSKGKAPEKYIKKYFSRCENYVQVMSGSVPGTAIVEGDCRTRFFSGDAIPIFANYFPGGACGKILQACIDEGSLFEVTGTLQNSGGIIGFVHGPDRIEPSESATPPFKILKHTGHLASFRKQGKKSVRFQMTGSRPNPSHSHFDKGSIVLEIDNYPVLIDRGMVYYHHSDAHLLKRSDFHNVLTPVLKDGTYPDQKYPTSPIIPVGHGSDRDLNAKIRLANVWTDYMASYTRFVESEQPGEIHIMDKGQLKEKGRLAFHLQSNYPFEISGKKIYLTGPTRPLTILTPWATHRTCRLESIDLMHAPVYHLVVESRELKEFDLKTTFKF